MVCYDFYEIVYITHLSTENDNSVVTTSWSCIFDNLLVDFGIINDDSGILYRCPAIDKGLQQTHVFSMPIPFLLLSIKDASKNLFYITTHCCMNNLYQYWSIPTFFCSVDVSFNTPYYTETPITPTTEDVFTAIHQQTFHSFIVAADVSRICMYMYFCKIYCVVSRVAIIFGLNGVVWDNIQVKGYHSISGIWR